MEKVLQIDVLTGVFRLLSDETRLRILSLLRANELAVGELQKILGLGQSTLSTQLGLLKEQDLVASRKEGQKVFYRIPSKEDPKLAILASALQSADGAKWHGRDMRNLKKVLEDRSDESRQFFDSQAVQNMPSPGQTWKALCRGLIRLIHGRRIVDLGCGNGRLAILLAQAGNTVIGVDDSEGQIRLARENAARESGNAARESGDAARAASDASAGKAPEFIKAAMEATGLPAGGFDIVIASQSLHHAANPREAVAESHRLLAPGGRLLILDLLSHGEEWMRSKFGDFWLGFSLADLEGWLKEAGFRGIHSEITGASRDYPDIEGVLVQAEKA